MRTIGVVTGSRADYGNYLPVLRKIKSRPDLELKLLVTGTHLVSEYGFTIEEIKKDGFKIAAQVETLLSSDSPDGISKSIGLGVIGFADIYRRLNLDLLLVLGDRYEMFAAVIAAIPFAMPIAHIHGGESTHGLIDESIRHSITKISHLHFVSTKAYRNNVVQMGEETWRVFVTGAPTVDNLRIIKLFSKKQLERKYGFSLKKPPLLVTFHPVTLEYQNVALHVSELLYALSKVDSAIIFTYPNADTQGRVIINAINRFVAQHSNAKVVKSLGTQAYFSLMKYSAAMVGNSSSGIVESGSFQLPVVNIGNRQGGRIQGRNVIQVNCTSRSILDGIQKALHPSFRTSLISMKNIYGNGHAADKIVRIIGKFPLNTKLMIKKFHRINS
jgi:UDP-hydrolysing UDP-N-acetyl-D-glucosamine 2-epimerase